jgi:hypothetical protein
MTAIARHATFAVIAVLVMSALGWLLTGETSPVHGYFIWHVGVPNVWRTLNSPAFVFSAIAGGNVHQPSFLLFAVAFVFQWAVVGVFISWALRKLTTDNLRQIR